MKLIISGGRDRNLTPVDFEKLDSLLNEHEITEVVSGGATGVDAGGEEWADKNGIPLTIMPAEWDKWGKKAGPMRNGKMARYADALAYFEGGNGTANMVANAEVQRLQIFDLRRKSR